MNAEFRKIYHKILTSMDNADKFKEELKNKRINCHHRFEMVHHELTEDDEGNDAIKIVVQCNLCGTFTEWIGTLVYQDEQGM